MSTSLDFESTSPAFYDRWLDQHGLTIADLENFAVIALPSTKALYIPVYSLTGKFSFALLRHFAASANIRYEVTPPGSRRGFVLYGLYKSVDKLANGRIVVLVEGFSDLIAIQKMGCLNSAALLGSQLTEVQAATLASLCNTVILWMDGDDAGINYIYDAITKKWPFRLLCIAVEGMDPAEYVAAGGSVDLVIRVAEESLGRYCFVRLAGNGTIAEVRSNDNTVYEGR